MVLERRREGATNEDPAGPGLLPSPGGVPAWPFVVLAVPILVRAALFGAALVADPIADDPRRIIPAWAQIVQASLFALIGLVLLYYGSADRRAWSLGLFVIDAGSTLLEPFVRSIADPAWPVRAGFLIRTDAFQAALVWFFASEFPRRSRRAWLRQLFTAATVAALALGVVLAAMDAYAVLSAGDTPLRRLAAALQRQRPDGRDWYFSLQFFALLPLLVLQPLKLREWGPDDRRRFAWLVGGLAVGFLPLATLAVLSAVVPDLVTRFQPWWRAIGLVIVLFLTLVPISAAYAALVQRTLDLRVAVRAALQYLLARWVITLVAALPLAGLIVLIVVNRDRPLSDLVRGTEGLLLVGLALAGFVAALARTRLLTALDRGFFRERLDARRTLLEVIDSARQASTLSGLCGTVSGAVTSALHPSQICTFVIGTDDAFHAQDTDLPSLESFSALAQLVNGDDAPLAVDARPGSMMERLSAQDRDWLTAANARMLVPLRGASGQLLGIMTLAEKRSELPYSNEDSSLLATVGSACGLALERVLTSERQGSTPSGASLPNPAGRECLECGTVLEPDAIACACGGLCQRAAVPYQLEDRLRFVRRVGAGAAGVVYRAVDLRLQQPRAVKTLTGTDPVLIARFKREARAMAAATHVNLATLYGLDFWRGSPLLVMEFLDGGTLADRLRRSPLPIADVLAMGVSLAQAVGVLHATGTLHRDIKPSNIGFTGDGVPKLLDFGLAKLLASPKPGDRAADGFGSTLTVGATTQAGAVRGTPAYLSPEVLCGASPQPSDDLWSLAVTLFEAAVGTNPFRGASVPATLSRVISGAHQAAVASADFSESVRHLFADLLGPHERRPETAYEFVRRLTLEQTRLR